MTTTRGWYVVSPTPNASRLVHGGPYRTKREALNAIFAGLLIRNGEVEIEYMSASEIQRRSSMLRFPKSKEDAR